jgi:hypothetical protein
MVPPVQTHSSVGQSTFPVGYEQVWKTLVQILTGYEFQLTLQDKAGGRLETEFMVFSKHPKFSQLKTGVRAYSRTPRTFLHKWLDGRMRIRVLLTKASAYSTQVVVEPEIQGFTVSVFDDSTVTGEWKECRTNGKFEFELINELATRLKDKPVVVNASPAGAGSASVPAAKGSANKTTEKEQTDLANLLLQSVPEGAEVFLNDRLVGMTPSRLSVPPGEYKVLFRKPGYKEYQRTITVLKRSDLTISYELEALPASQQGDSPK